MSCWARRGAARGRRGWELPEGRGAPEWQGYCTKGPRWGRFARQAGYAAASAGTGEGEASPSRRRRRRARRAAALCRRRSAAAGWWRPAAARRLRGRERGCGVAVRGLEGCGGVGCGGVRTAWPVPQARQGRRSCPGLPSRPLTPCKVGPHSAAHYITLHIQARQARPPTTPMSCRLPATQTYTTQAPRQSLPLHSLPPFASQIFQIHSNTFHHIPASQPRAHPPRGWPPSGELI